MRLPLSPAPAAILLLLAGFDGPAAAPRPPAPLLSTDVFPEGVTTESEYEGWLAAQRDAFAEALASGSVEATTTGLARHANWILAFYSEPPLTRALLGIAGPEDLEQLAQRVAEARKLLDQVDATTLPPAERDRLECLQAFAVAIERFCRFRRGQADPAEVVGAADELSVWLDDDRADIRESARLVVCLLQSDLGRMQQALTVLPLATAPIESSDAAAAIYARALRCQIQARLGYEVPALALLLKMEERCGEWLPSEPQARAAEAMLTWHRLQIARDYGGSVGPVARQSIDRSIAEARAALFEGQQPGLMRLHPAVPLLFVAQAVPAPAPEPDRAAPEAPDQD